MFEKRYAGAIFVVVCRCDVYVSDAVLFIDDIFAFQRRYTGAIFAYILFVHNKENTSYVNNC